MYNPIKRYMEYKENLKKANEIEIKKRDETTQLFIKEMLKQYRTWKEKWDQSPDSKKTCPECKSKNVAVILYGKRIIDHNDIHAGKVVEGGCVIGPNSKGWKCNNCGKHFGAVLDI